MAGQKAFSRRAICEGLSYGVSTDIYEVCTGYSSVSSLGEGTHHSILTGSCRVKQDPGFAYGEGLLDAHSPISLKEQDLELEDPSSDSGSSRN